MSNIVRGILTPEDLATQLEKTVTDIVIEQQLGKKGISPQYEYIGRVTDSLFSDPEVDILRSYSQHTGVPEEHVAGLRDIETTLKTSTKELWDEIRQWVSSTFHTAKDKLEEIAKKIVDLAQRLGVSIAHVLSRLYRRLVHFLVVSSVLPPFTVGHGTDGITLKPTEVSFSVLAKSSPSLVDLDIQGVVKFLNQLLAMELSISVKYSGG